MTQRASVVPFSICVVVTFLFCLSLFQLAVLLNMCLSAEAMTQQVLLEIALHGILSLLALLLAIHVLLCLPFARACALFLFFALPLMKALGYAASPVQWQLAGASRIQDVFAAAVFILMSALLMTAAARRYLTASTTPPAPTES